MHVARQLDHLDQALVGRKTRDNQTSALELVTEGVVELKAVTVTLVDELLAICLAREGIGGKLARIGTQTHGAPLLGHVLLRAHQVDDTIRAIRIELGRAGAGKADDVAGKFAHGHLHTQANAQIRNLVLAGELGREDLALQGALTKAARDQDARGVTQDLGDVLLIEALAIDQLHVNVAIVEDARMVQGLDNRQVRIGQLRVLAHNGDLHLVGVMVGVILFAQELVPLAHVALTRVQTQALANAQVKVLLGKQLRNIVNARAVLVGKDAIGVDVAEACDLSADSVIDMVVGAQHDNIGLDTKAAELLDGMLRGLGLDLVGGGDIGNERHVDVADVLGAGLLAILTNGLDKRLRLDVTDGAAQLSDDHVGAGLLLNTTELILNGVRDVRNHLHGAAQKVTATFAGDQTLIDGTSRKVGIAGQVLVNKALVVAQVQIGLVAVLGHKDLAMLERAHGTGVDVQIRVGLLHRYFVATRLEQTAQRGRGNTLAQGRNHATGYEHMLGHIELPALPVEVFYPHLTGLHCNTRAADRSQFFSRAIAFLNLETKRRPVSQAASLWQGLHAAIDQQPRPQAFLERACRYGRPQDTTRHVR